MWRREIGLTPSTKRCWLTRRSSHRVRGYCSPRSSCLCDPGTRRSCSPARQRATTALRGAASDLKYFCTFICKVGAVGMVGKTPPRSAGGASGSLFRPVCRSYCHGTLTCHFPRSCGPRRKVGGQLGRRLAARSAAIGEKPPTGSPIDDADLPDEGSHKQRRRRRDSRSPAPSGDHKSAGSGLCPTLYTTASRSRAYRGCWPRRHYRDLIHHTCRWKRAFRDHSRGELSTAVPPRQAPT
jgi:hypothetical protein